MVSTESPTRRSTSARVRTVVVLPVPPFSDRTAIVSAMEGRDLRGSVGQGRRLGGAGADGGGVEVVDGVAPDSDFVAVGQRRPVDAIAVDVDAVERAVVEHAYTVRLVHHQRMTAGHGRIVEADVGGQRAADPGPFARDGRHDAAAGVLVGQVLAGNGEPRACLGDPFGLRRDRGRGLFFCERNRALTGERQGASRLRFAGRAWIHQSLLWRATRAVPATRPPRGIIREGQWGRDRMAGSERLCCPAAKLPKPCFPPPRRHRSRRRCCAGASGSSPTSGPAACTATARRWSASGSTSTRRRSSASCAGRAAATPRSAASSCARRSTSGPSASVRAASGRTPGAVDPVELTITIDRPREEVFEYLADIANHPEFTDHYLKHWRLTRADSYGRGAGARYKMDGPFQRFGWSDLTFIKVDAPREIVAVGRGGKFNRIKTYASWTLEPASGGTRVEFVFETEPKLPTV